MITRYRTIVIGAGHAGVHAVHSLISGGHDETIALISAEPHPPYERPPLSKAFLRGEVDLDNILLRGAEYWSAHAIDLFLGERVRSIDPETKKVFTDSGREFGYDNLVWAAGGQPRELPISGADLRGVHSLRDFADATAIATDMATARNGVVIGGGHIGLEIASAFRHRGIGVTVLEAQSRLLARVTSPAVSDHYTELHRSNGVDVRLDAQVESIVGTDGNVNGVAIGDGTVIPADIVVVGIGLIPSVEPLRALGVVCSNGVDTDEDGRTGLDGVYAIGDCANQVSPFSNGKRVRLESVPASSEQAKRAAAAILGKPRPAATAPWFWSHQYDVKLQTAGLFTGYEHAVVRGRPASGNFSVLYLDCSGTVIAIDCVNSTRDFAVGRRLVDARRHVDRESAADPDVPLKNFLNGVAAVST